MAEVIYDADASPPLQGQQRRACSILRYTVSIHKAQGLEYNSAKEVIPSSNSEQISHGIFYTAITRAKEKLKIF